MKNSPSGKTTLLFNLLLMLLIFLASVFGFQRSYGQTFNDPAAAAANTTWFNAQAATGLVDFTGHNGTLFVNGVLVAPHQTASLRIKSDAAWTYPSDGNWQLQNKYLRIVQLGSCPTLRLGGTGFVSTDPIEWVGSGSYPIVEIEGRTNPASGRHVFENQTFWRGTSAIRTLTGYYNDSGVFVTDVNHADNCHFTNCFFSDVDTVFQSDNVQGVNFRFRDCTFEQWQKSSDVVFADIVRGGHILADGCIVNCPKFTIFRLHDLALNVGSLTFTNFERDRTTAPGNYLTVVDYKYTGDPRTDRWDIIVNGKVNTYFAPLSKSKLIVAPINLPRTYWKINISDVAGEMK